MLQDGKHSATFTLLRDVGWNHSRKQTIKAVWLHGMRNFLIRVCCTHTQHDLWQDTCVASRRLVALPASTLLLVDASCAACLADRFIFGRCKLHFRK